MHVLHAMGVRLHPCAQTPCGGACSTRSVLLLLTRAACPTSLALPCPALPPPTPPHPRSSPPLWRMTAGLVCLNILDTPTRFDAPKDSVSTQ